MDDGLQFAVVGTDRQCRRVYHKTTIETARFDVTNLVVRDLATDGFDVSQEQEGMISTAIAAWQETVRAR